MNVFRKFYYKILILFALASTFSFLFNGDSVGIGFGCFYVFTGILCFGALSIGRAEIDPEKIIRNILLFLLWALLGFGIMAMGIVALMGSEQTKDMLTMFLIFPGFALTIVYLISIIKNKEWFAIASVALVIGGFVLGANSNGIFILQLLTIVLLAAAVVLFVFSIFKGLADDD